MNDDPILRLLRAKQEAAAGVDSAPVVPDWLDSDPDPEPEQEALPMTGDPTMDLFPDEQVIEVPDLQDPPEIVHRWEEPVQLSLPGIEPAPTSAPQNEDLLEVTDARMTQMQQEAEKTTEASLLKFSPRPVRQSRFGGYSSETIRKVMAADRMHPGVKLGRLCISKQISVKEVVERLKVSKPTVYAWFTGMQYPKEDQLEKVREALVAFSALRK